MAFISFDFTPPVAALFTPLERTVIQISLNDRPESLREPRPWRARLNRLVARRTTTRLADPRLEQLRRAAVLLRHQGELGAEEAARFARSGFTDLQYQALRNALCPADCDRISAAPSGLRRPAAHPRR